MKKVSVILPVFNQEKYLGEALESLVKQEKWGREEAGERSWRKGEIIIINDGSSDKTREIIVSFRDKLPIKLIEHEENLGLAKSLNEGLATAQGEFIARMDGDDKMTSDRLRRELDFLEKNKEIDLVGGRIRIFNENGYGGEAKLLPQNDQEIKRAMLSYCALMHPTLMWRRSWQEKVGFHYLEDECWRGAEDYATWLYFLDKMTLANLPEILLDYRQHQEQVSYKLAKRQKRLTRKLKWRARIKYWRYW